MTFSLVRQSPQTETRRARVASVEEVTPRCRRIVLTGSGVAELSRLDEPEAAGAVRSIRVHFSEDDSREYTAVRGDDADSLAIDVVIHGDGVGSNWAERVEPGMEVDVSGPGDSLTIDGAPDWWLLVGDETALPAIRRHLASVAPGTPVRAIVSVADADAEQALESPGELDARWVHPAADVPSGSVAPLVDALVAVTPLLGTESGDGVAFVAGEQSIVKPAEDVLLGEWGLPPEHAVIAGYWKRGEAGFPSPN